MFRRLTFDPQRTKTYRNLGLHFVDRLDNGKWWKEFDFNDLK